MATDNERREIAYRLRNMSKYTNPDNVYDSLSQATGVDDVIDGNGSLVAYLADLIGPSIPSDPGEAGLASVDGFIREMRHSTKEEHDEYSAMLEKMSVELHPVDRDALLALAEEMEGEKRDISCATCRDDFGLACYDYKPNATCMEACLRYYARRIREALGVHDG